MRITFISALMAAGLALSACGNAEFDRGWAAYQKGDMETAYAAFKPLAENGNAAAQNDLGMIYRDGTKDGKIKPNYAEALKWFHKSADQGYSFAYNNIGLLYELGWGLPKNVNESFKYYQKAVDTAESVGDYYAYDNLGRMYEHGWGVPKNVDKAIALYKKAAAMGYVTAQNNLKRLGVSGS